MNKLRPELARSQIIELIRRTVIYRVQQDLEKSNNKRTPQFIDRRWRGEFKKPPDGVAWG
jgi:hypothetical protein